MPRGSPLAQFRAPGDLLERIDKAAEAAGQDRSTWLREVVEGRLGVASIMVNINTRATVIINQRGADAYNRSHEGIPQRLWEPKQAGDIWTTQMHDLMSTLGPEVGVALMDHPFEKFAVRLDVRAKDPVPDMFELEQR